MDMLEYQGLVYDEPALRPQTDHLPEFTQYRDDGCDISPTCLRCPLPKCRYDDPGWLGREAKAKRDSEVLALRQEEGLGPTELAKRFGLSRRTIHRIIRENQGIDS